MPADKASGFLLSLLSPVWRAKLCGDIGGKARWQLELDRSEAGLFSKVVALGSGAAVTMEGGLEAAVGLGQMADRYQVEAVHGAVEDAVMRLLTVESCGRVLACGLGSGLGRVERASRELALREFDEFARTARFMEVGEEALGSLLDDDGLVTEREERVFEAVVRWMKGGEVRGSGLLRKVRFPFMDGKYLADVSSEPGVEDVGLEGLLLDALVLKSEPREAWGRRRLRYLDRRVLVPRGSVRWEEYVGGGERRLAAGLPVHCVAAHGAYVCGGLEDGSIRVWSRSTLEQDQTLAGHTRAVVSLLSAGGKLISGAKDDSIRVWDVAGGRCENVLEGHVGWLTSLAASGGRLLSGSWDGTVRVWGMEGGASRWPCERTLGDAVSGSSVFCVQGWEGRVAGGCEDGGIRVWRAETWGLEWTLRGHKDGVCALAVSGGRLISSSSDRTVRVWSTETWGCVQTVEVYPAGSPQHIYRLAVSGPTLAGGSVSDPLSASDSVSEEHEVRVWDLEKLRPLHTIKQPLGKGVRSLVGDGGLVWGAVGDEVVVWGRRG